MRRMRMDLAERFMDKVDKHGGMPDFSDPLVRLKESDGECWLWRAAKSAGYGRLKVNGRLEMAHRVAIFLDKGEWPSRGMQVDHLCRTPACVRASHLEVVTPSLNTLRGLSPLRGPRAKCSRGHVMQGWNVVTDAQGRHCRECKNQRNREWMRKARAA